MKNSNEYTTNETVTYFKNMSRTIYYLGSPDISIRPIIRPKVVQTIHNIYKFLTDVLGVVMIMAEIGAVFTQTHLTERQKSNNAVFAVRHPFLYSFIFNIAYYKEEVKDLLNYLIIELKKPYCDKEVEMVMIRKIKIFNAGFMFVFLSAVALYGVEALIQVIWKDATFTTVLTAWPDIRDKSKLANICRIISYVVYLSFMIKLCCAYIIVIPVTICISYQFKNLQSYFRNLGNIFEDELNQEEKELKYENAFKAGVALHSQTIWCTRQCQTIFQIIFSSQVILNVTTITIMMMQMVNSERTLFGIFTTVFGMSSILFSTGVIMLSAGNVTSEALEVATAIYSSGWENCTLSTSRMSKLLLFSMTQAQQPVILMVFSIVPLSYESFVKIVKSSYTIFSVLY